MSLALLLQGLLVVGAPSLQAGAGRYTAEDSLPPPPPPPPPLPVITIEDARAKEGDAGPTTLVFKVDLSAPSSDSVRVHYVSDDGTATTADADFDFAKGVLCFPPHSIVETIEVTIQGDVKLEGNEWFRLRLTDPVHAALGDSEAVGTLVNDERTTFMLVDTHFAPYNSGNLPNAWGDMNGDGTPDLPLYQLEPNGTMNEIPGFRALIEGGGANYHGVAWCDYDRDGDSDVVLLGYTGVLAFPPGRAPGLEATDREATRESAESPLALLSEVETTPTRLLRNDGLVGFVDVAPAQGMDIIGCGETAVWADFDGDGWPDLFAPYYSHIYPFQSFLYHNNGDGTFTDRATPAGVSLPNLPLQLRPEGAQAADWNDDGYTDLYCASHLFLNDGTGVFRDVRESTGLPVLFDEGAALVDIDQDGDLDLFLRALDGPRLFRNDAGKSTDVTVPAGLEPLPTLWGDSWADADGDGDLDLLLQSNEHETRLMLNQGDGTFERDPGFEQLGILPELTAWADVDGDGDLDLVLGNGPRRDLYLNQLNILPGYEGSQVAVRVLDENGHQTAHGATVRLHQVGGPPGTTQTRVVDGGSGYLGQNQYEVHFGGLAAGRFALEVAYPSPAGSRVVVDSLTNPRLGDFGPANNVITVRRDGTVTAYRRAGTATASRHAGVMAATAAGAPMSPDRLGLPSPMPARGDVTLPFQLSHGARVALVLHDLAGRIVRTIEPGVMPTGPHSVSWDLRDTRGSAAAPGIYLCRLVVRGRTVDVRRLVVAR